MRFLLISFLLILSLFVVCRTSSLDCMLSLSQAQRIFFFFLFKYVLYFKVLLALITALHNIGNIFTSVMRSSPEMLVQGVPTYAEHLSAAFPFVVHLIPVWHSWVNVTLTKPKGMFWLTRKAPNPPINTIKAAHQFFTVGTTHGNAIHSPFSASQKKLNSWTQKSKIVTSWAKQISTSLMSIWRLGWVSAFGSVSFFLSHSCVLSS